MAECIFCRIARGTQTAGIVYEDDQAVAFDDINPRAPVHVLIVPRKHLTNLQAAAAEDEALLGHLLRVANEVARLKGVEDDGYRVIANVGRDAGQSVDHLHLHVLGGRRMTWPPG